MSGAWLKEEGFSTVAGSGSLGEVRLLRRPLGPKVDPHEDQVCWHRSGRTEIEPGAGEECWQASNGEGILTSSD